jgi:hypothetical protein
MLVRLRAAVRLHLELEEEDPSLFREEEEDDDVLVALARGVLARRGQ